MLDQHYNIIANFCDGPVSRQLLGEMRISDPEVEACP